MDHNEAVRQQATEKYLLNELDSTLRDQFEEHLFDCQECALDVRAAAMFVEQTKVVLAESPETSAARVRAASPARAGWFSWLRPAFAAPALALLLAVVGYQNFISYPRLMEAVNEPQVGPWASVNVSTRGSEARVIKVHPGGGFSLLINVPPDPTYSTYTLQLYNPAGRLQWSRTIPASSPDDARSIYIPGAGLGQGNYTLTVKGTTSTGQSSDLGKYPIELQFRNEFEMVPGK
jgi:hypothetical protein